MEVIKVSSQSNPNAVAGAIASLIREHGSVGIQVVGAAAVNQAMKGIAIARGYVAPSGKDLIFIPSFAEITINGEERTAIKILVEPR